MTAVVHDITTTARVERGKLFIRGRRQFDRLVAQLPDGWEMELSLTRLRSTRSLEANAYYWGVVLAILADYTGYSADELHDVCRAKFLSKQLAVCNGNGEIVGEFVLGGSTRKLTTQEFYDYVERIRVWMRDDLDCPTDDPDPKYWRKRHAEETTDGPE
jgi:hypothetical protein